jgi:ammonium transporter Rh
MAGKVAPDANGSNGAFEEAKPGTLPIASRMAAGSTGDDVDVSGESKMFMILVLIMQIVIAVLLGAMGVEVALDPDLRGKYGYFRDVNIMIFFGFGMLMTFLRRYGYSAIGYCMIVSALCAQFSLPLKLLLMGSHGGGDHNYVDLVGLMEGLFCAGAVMISYGAVLGKTSPTQLFVMGILESVFFWINTRLVFTDIGAHDVGGGMVIHSFGCYFGLAATVFFTKADTKDRPDEAACYSSDLFSLMGTLLLWLLWPSFNAAVAGTPAAENLAIANTFVSLCGCVLGTALTTRLLCGGRFDTVHIQNATLAGGVMMGTVGDFPLGLHTACIAGFLSGILSTFGYVVITPKLNKMGIQDVCGVNNLHGMPGIAGALLAVAVVEIEGAGKASTQLVALACTLGIAIVSGAITGKIMQLMDSCTVKIPAQGMFNDKTFWNIPTDYVCVVDEV